jgi:flagellin
MSVETVLRTRSGRRRGSVRNLANALKHMAVSPISSILSDIVGQQVASVLNTNLLALQKSAVRLASGLRIVNAGDDPGGAGVATRVGNQISRTGAAQDAITNALSYIDTQSGFLDDVETALDRMSELATLASDGTISAETRSSYQAEFADLQAFVSNTGGKTFNQVGLFTTSTLTTVISGDGETFSLQPLNYSSVGSSGGLASAYAGTISLGSSGSAATALSAVSTAIANLGIMQARAGSNSEVLDLYNGTLTTLSDNLTDVKNRIVATDLTTESNNFSRLSVLVEGGSSVLAEWNTLRRNLLTLLQ